MRKLMAVAALTAILSNSALASEEWQFTLTPYLWFAGLKGDLAAAPPLPAAPVDISAKDALDDNETSFMALFTARRGHHGLLMDFIYTDTRSDEELVPEIDLKLRSISKNTIVSAAYLYRLFDDGGTNLDGFAGVRYWDIDVTLQFSGGLGVLAGQRINNTEDWFDPMLGLKGNTPLGDSNFYVAGWAALGGFGVNSDLFYDASVNFGYQWTKAIGTAVGYRVFDVDYDNDQFVYDVRQHGFALGLTWGF